MGEGDFEEFELLSDAAASRGGDVVFCDVTQWPGEKPITYAPEEDGATLGTEIDYDEISGVYAHPAELFRPLTLRFHDALDENLWPTLNQIREHRAIFESVCYTLDRRGVTVIPPLRNYRWHDRKPWQMKLCNDEGVPVPDTLFTNSPDAVRRFFRDHDEVIYKPVSRGGSPKRLTDEDLTEARLADLATAPVQFQEFAPGEDIRVYFLDGEVIGGIRYLSENFSFKVDLMDGDDVDVEAFRPSAEMKAAVERAAEKSGLVFGGVDIRRESDAEFEILELNDVPRFAAADMLTEQDIAGELAEFLLNGG